VFFDLDQFACRWQQREDIAPIIQRPFTHDATTDIVMSGSEPALEFGLIMLRLMVSNELQEDSTAFLQFVFSKVFPFARPASRNYESVKSLGRIEHNVCFND
jgi:hypothetical protein